MGRLNSGVRRQHRIFMRRVAIALISLAPLACSGTQLLSSRNTWGDFATRSPPTDECPGGTIKQLGTRMAVSSPYILADFEPTVPNLIRSRISSDHRLYSYQFSTDPESDNYWGFSGYLVARGNCIVHAEVTGYDN
jgi:hypothetical protein